MKIAFVCYFEKGRISGPSNSMTSLATRGEDFDHQCSVFTSSKDCCDEFYLNGVKVGLLNELLSELKNYDLVVMSGLFDWQIFRLAFSCVVNNVNYVFSPRSNLMLEALKKGQFKKKLALLTYSGFVVRRAKYIHFLSDEEMRNSVCVNNDSFVARNGVTGLNRIVDDARPKDNIISFIGRFDISHKGIDLLLVSLSLIRDQIMEFNWRVELYGPSTKGVTEQLNERILQLGLSNVVKLYPPITGESKFILLSKSKVFLHPSRYEGQPQSVIEAMACGAIPVVTIGANMSKYVEPFVPSTIFCAKTYSQAILKAMNMAKYAENHKKISRYALNCFSWDLASEEFYSNISID
ncbi:glycosyltransferase [Vibrio sp. Isolate22]|uniref:glycosyltransferase n=1 Tax=Vibrio sp. Isolate22 TaxID=2908532 RepID=UPI001EFE4227|nr:glycosyltransferase [Vibrio sp. Isolate22]MCG9694540.1 glycosyltransferase [Vibrio sp. Isolate22]